MKNSLLLFVIILSCTTDYKLHNAENKQLSITDVEIDATFPVPEIEEDDSGIIPPVDEPDIEIEFAPSGRMSVKPGCSEFGRFVVRNVGSADLIINELDSYASAPIDVQVTSSPVVLPMTLTPGGSYAIDFNVNQSDTIEDKIIVVAKSNDPDEQTAYDDATYSSDISGLKSENFTITENKAADILMVVDNSCSMSEEQSVLSSNAELFVDSLDSRMIDYKIAVITTDNPRFVGPVITPATIDPALELSTQVNVGTYGSPYETGIKMASDALAPTGMAAPGGAFLRSDARLSIIWISDEDDFSGGTTYTWSSDFWSKKSAPGDVSVWGIIGDPIYGCSTAAPGDLYNDLITTMGGGWSSICSADWGSPMSVVAAGAGVDSTLELSSLPVIGSIHVFINGIESYDWVYVVSSNAISFNPGHVPATGSRIVVEYVIYGEC